MKKQYQKPTMKVVHMQHRCQILSGSPGAKNSMGASEQFARQHNGWDDDWDDEED